MSVLSTFTRTDPVPATGSCSAEAPARLRRYRMLIDRPGLAPFCGRGGGRGGSDLSGAHRQRLGNQSTSHGRPVAAGELIGAEVQPDVDLRALTSDAVQTAARRRSHINY